jgi:beta-glucanase (GH16 family)
MMLRSRRMHRFVIPLAIAMLATACTEGDREQPLSRVDPVVIPPADTTTRVNVNIDDPTLEIPTTFQVDDGDLLTLVWSDEFNGAQLDPEVWFFETGDGSEYGIPGWGNNELQWYLPDNARLEGGKLIIAAKRETVDGFGFTSARINTRDRFAFKYGRIEASIKLPSGQGLWPAFWMLPQDSPYGTWPSSGEIDILEAVNLDGFPGPGGFGGGNEIFGTLHFGGGALGRIIDGELYTPSTDVTEDFHTYALEWDEFEIRWYYDGILWAVKNAWVSDAAPYPAPFDQPFHILLNLAIGGDFPGQPDGSTPFPAEMEVDWVRVYSGEEPPPIVTPPADHGPGTGGVYTETITESTITVTGITNSVIYNGNNTVADPNSVAIPAFEGDVSLEIDYQDSGSTYGGAILEFGGVDLTAYDTLNFTIDTSGMAGFADLTIQIEPPGQGAAGTNVSLSSYDPVSTSGNWATYAIPLGDFTVTDFAAATNLGFWNPRDAGGALTFGTLYVDDVYFSTEGSGGGGNIAVNGGFETGDFTGWEQFPGGGVQTVTNVNPSSGTYAANLNIPVIGAGGLAIDNLIKNANLEAGNLAPNAAVTVSFDMRGSLAGAGGVVFAELFSELAGGGTSKAEILSGGSLTPADAWAPYSFNTTLGPDVAGGVTLQLKVGCGPVEGCGADVYFDNVSIVIN